MAGSPADQGDVAAAFVARKAIGDRLAAVEPLIDKNRRDAAALMAKPLTDSMGGPVGQGHRRRGQAARRDHPRGRAAPGRLRAAAGGGHRPGAGDRGRSRRRRAALARARRAGQPGGPAAPAAGGAARPAGARRHGGARCASALEQNDRERQRVLASFSVAPDRVQRLADREHDVRELAARCVEKMLRAAAPRRAVGRGARRRPGSGAGRAALPWKAARAQIEPFVDKLDRVERALDEAAGASPRRSPNETTCAACSTASAARPASHGFSEDPADRAGVPPGARAAVVGAVRPRRGTALGRRATSPGSTPGSPTAAGDERRDVDAPTSGRIVRVKCTQPFCTGTIVDGYCDVCGLAPTAVAPAAPAARSGAPLPPPRFAAVATTRRGQRPDRRYARRAGAQPRLVGHRQQPPRLGAVRLGAGRHREPPDPPARSAPVRRSRLGAGITQVPPVPVVDPRQALMDPPVVGEDKRFCSVCGSPVGRCARRTCRAQQGLLPEVPHPVRLRAAAGPRRAGRRSVRGGRLSGARRDGLDLPRPRPQRQRPLGGAQGSAQHR